MKLKLIFFIFMVCGLTGYGATVTQTNNYIYTGDVTIQKAPVSGTDAANYQAVIGSVSNWSYFPSKSNLNMSAKMVTNTSGIVIGGSLSHPDGGGSIIPYGNGLVMIDTNGQFIFNLSPTVKQFFSTNGVMVIDIQNRQLLDYEEISPWKVTGKASNGLEIVNYTTMVEKVNSSVSNWYQYPAIGDMLWGDSSGGLLTWSATNDNKGLEISAAYPRSSGASGPGIRMYGTNYSNLGNERNALELLVGGAYHPNYIPGELRFYQTNSIVAVMGTDNNWRFYNNSLTNINMVQANVVSNSTELAIKTGASGDIKFYLGNGISMTIDSLGVTVLPSLNAVGGINLDVGGNGASVVNSGNITPAITSTYDLGSPSLRWREIYVDIGSIWLGTNKLSITSQGVLAFGTEFVTNTVVTVTGTNSTGLIVAGSNTTMRIDGGTNYIDAQVQNWSTFPATGNRIELARQESGSGIGLVSLSDDDGILYTSASGLDLANNYDYGAGIFSVSTNYATVPEVRGNLILLAGGYDGDIYESTTGKIQFKQCSGDIMGSTPMAEIENNGDWDFMNHALSNVSSLVATDAYLNGSFNLTNGIGARMFAGSSSTNAILTGVQYGSSQWGYFSGTNNMSGAIGSVQRGWFNLTNTMGNCYGAVQQGYNSGGTLTMGNSSHGAIQSVYIANTGTVTMVGANNYGCLQLGYSSGSGREIIGFPTRASVQIFDNASGTATNIGQAAVQIHSLTNNQLALTTTSGDASLLIGAGISSNKNCIVAGDNEESHGAGSITAGGGFWTTNSPASGNWVVTHQAMVNYVTNSTYQGVGRAITYTTNHYTVTTNDYTILCDASLQGITNYLPNASNISGRILTFKRLDYGTNNYVTISPVTGQFIDSQTNISIYQSMKAVTIQSYTTNWYIIGGY